MMNRVAAEIGSAECMAVCANAASTEALNRDCLCLGVDPQALHAQLEAVLENNGTPASLAVTHAHLFSAMPVFVSRHHLDAVAKIVAALNDVVGTEAYQAAVMAWAPAIAAYDPGTPGGLLGIDFHLGPDGPRIIEINSNPGGALLNAMLGKAQRSCMPTMEITFAESADIHLALLDVMLAEWRLQRGDAPLRRVAIVDEAPVQQYLYPEFVLFRELFRKHGYQASICAPEQFVRRENRLWLDGEPIDFVYNRLTDFSLALPVNEALRSAYLGNEIVLSPHPRAHAIHADKRNLTLLCDPVFLGTTGLSRASMELLLVAVPTTERMTPENRDALWQRRRHLFFKPAAGFGSKASYRGDKLTRRVWEEIALGEYVAQALVPPGERQVAPGEPALKFDLRCYAYRGKVLLHAARMYQGQTTNFRTPGGGFAPVLTGEVAV